MGYRKVPVIRTLDKIPGEEGFVVRLKSVKFGKVRELLRLTDENDDMGADEIGKIQKIFLDGLVSWNLEDEYGIPVPATQEGVDDQDFDFVLKVIGAWLEALTGVDEELGKDSPSGKLFPGQPVTMEAL